MYVCVCACVCGCVCIFMYNLLYVCVCVLQSHTYTHTEFDLGAFDKLVSEDVLLSECVLFLQDFDLDTFDAF
jgi:hypothetical protein